MPMAILARASGAFVLSAIWLSSCATGASDPVLLAPCPPVVEYNREFQELATEELALLPEGSAIVEMLTVYAVMREQALFSLAYSLPPIA